MNPQIIEATKDDLERLTNLFQFYIYDFSAYIDVDLEENGRFKDYPLKDYLTEKNHFTYLVMVNEKYIGGFVLVKWVETDTKSFFSITEFFIMKKYRRVGLGKLVAKQIFRLHRGQWEVFQMKKNEPAQLFWRNVIEEYTEGQFTEWVEKGRRITQAFFS